MTTRPSFAQRVLGAWVRFLLQQAPHASAVALDRSGWPPLPETPPRPQRTDAGAWFGGGTPSPWNRR